LQIKTNHRLFPKAYIQEHLQDGPGRVWIVLTGAAPNGAELVAIGYKYSSKRVLFFVMSKGAGSTRPGIPYEMKFPDSYGNVCVRLVDRPRCLSYFFDHSDVVDRINHLRQGELALEERWPTQNASFRERTTFEGMTVTDTYGLGRFHGLLPMRNANDCAIPIRSFGGILSKQILDEAARCRASAAIARPLPSLAGRTVERAGTVLTPYLVPAYEDALMVDEDGTVHPTLILPVIFTGNRNRRKTRRCNWCTNFAGQRSWTPVVCGSCGVAYCVPTRANHGRDCFMDHVRNCGPPTAEQRKDRNTNRIDNDWEFGAGAHGGILRLSIE